MKGVFIGKGYFADQNAQVLLTRAYALCLSDN